MREPLVIAAAGGLTYAKSGLAKLSINPLSAVPLYPRVAVSVSHPVAGDSKRIALPRSLQRQPNAKTLYQIGAVAVPSKRRSLSDWNG